MESLGQKGDHDYIVHNVQGTSGENQNPPTNENAQFSNPTPSSTVLQQINGKPRPLVRVIPVAKRQSATTGTHTSPVVKGTTEQTKSPIKSLGKEGDELSGNVMSKPQSPRNSTSVATHSGKQFQTFPTKEDSGDHLEETDGGNICTVCKEPFENEGLLNEHLVAHCGMNPPSCFACDKKFKTLSDLKRHIANATHSTKKPRSRNVRSKSRNSKNSASVVTHTGKQFHLCTVCNKAFPTKEDLDDHLEDTHGGYICAVCKEPFESEGLLNEHQLTHCGMDPCSCFVCDKKFKTPSDLKRHIANATHSTTKKTWQCEICLKIYRGRKNYRIHMRRHRGEFPYTCDVCGKAYPEKKPLIFHIRTHTGEKPYQCAVCGKAFTTKGHLRQHALVHEDTKAHQCGVCGKEFRWLQDMRKHAWVHSEQKPYVCSLCNKQFIRKAYLKTHLTKRHPGHKITESDLSRKNAENTSNALSAPNKDSKEKPMVEHQLQQVLQQNVYVEQNFEVAPVELLNESEQSTQMNNIQIEIPGNITIIIDSSNSQLQHQLVTSDDLNAKQELVFTNAPQEDEADTYDASQDQDVDEQPVHIVNLNEPPKVTKITKAVVEDPSNFVVTHTGKKFQLCNTCNMAFPSESLLNQHLISVHGERMRFKCSLCPKVFLGKMGLKHHQSVHTGEKPYKCTVCNKTFRLKGNLNEHFQTHTEDKPHECTTCGKRFRRRIALTEHLPQHTGEKPYLCNLCPERFARKQGLKHHLVRHSGAKPHQCSLCGRTFTIIQNLTAHMQTKHKMKQPYKCGACDETFTQQAELHEHLKIHSEGKGIITCSVCKRIFTCEEDLKRHSVIHITDKPHKCTMCEKGFLNKCDLRKHIKRHKQ